MDVTFYGRLAEFAGRRITIAVPPSGCRLAELRQRIGEQHPALGAALGGDGISAFVKDGVAGDDTHLSALDEIEFWPPVSGG